MAIDNMIYTGSFAPLPCKGREILKNLALVLAEMERLGQCMDSAPEREIEPDEEYYIVLEHGLWYFDRY